MELTEIVTELKKENLSALGELYKLLSKKIYNRCFFILKDEQLAEDCTQELFLKTFTRIKSLEENSNVEAWMNRMAYNYCIDVIREKKKNKTYSSTETPTDKQSISNWIEEIEQIEQSISQKTVLKKKIDQLKETNRVILLMYYWEGYNVAEIADILDMGVSAVKMKLKRTRDHLKAELEQLGYKHSIEIATILILGII